MPYDRDESHVVAAMPPARLPITARLIATRENIAWGVMPLDRTQEILTGTTQGLMELFLSEAAYRAAIEGLNEQQVFEMVRLHMDNAGAYLSDMVDSLGGDAGRLAAIAMTLRHARPAPANTAVLDDVALWSLQAYQVSYLTGRIVEFKAEDVSMMIQWRATLLGLEQNVLSESAPATDMAKAAEIARDQYLLTFNELAQVAKELGDPSYTRAPARDHQKRLVLVSHNNPLINIRVAQQQLPATEWHDALLVPLTQDEIERISKIDKPIVLYLSMEEYSKAISLLTPAQLEYDLRKRKTVGLTTRDKVNRIVELRLALIGHIGGLITAASTLSPGDGTVAVRLKTVQNRELSLLAGFLRASLWLGPESSSPLNNESLRGAYRLLHYRLKIMKYFCQTGNEPDLVDTLTGMIGLIERIKERLDRL